MGGGAVLLILVALVVLLAAFVGGVLYFLKKTDPKNQDSSENSSSKCAQEFLPFDNIRENTIMLGNHRYRAIVECTSVNYQLKTPAERDQIEASFQRFLNTVTFPITFFIQTKLIDNTARYKELCKEIDETLQVFPYMRQYAEAYKKDMHDLNARIGNNQQKKKYIIVTYDEAQEMSMLDENEKNHFAAKEIMNRCNLLITNLESVGVKARILDTAELIELVYSCYYRDDFSYAEAIANEDAFKLFIDGEKDHFANMSKSALLDLILKEAINQAELGNLEIDQNGKAVLNGLRNLRNQYGGYYAAGNR